MFWLFPFLYSVVAKVFYVLLAVTDHSNKCLSSIFLSLFSQFFEFFVYVFFLWYSSKPLFFGTSFSAVIALILVPNMGVVNWSPCMFRATRYVGTFITILLNNIALDKLQR